ncbi:MAG: retron system putative HNH endonuclease [Saprospiraceae bacterium]
MRHIRKKSAPTKFRQYVKSIGADFDEMDADVKTELRNSLIAEQKGICAYCQQVLKDGQIKIEHHCERSICNGANGTMDRRLDYTNLLAVCKGNEGRPEHELHCDSRKACFNANNGLPIAINPTQAAHIRTISYSSTGKITSNNEQYDREINEILNLNLDYLKDNRQKKWNLFYRLSNRGNKDKMRKLLEADLATKNGKFTKQFAGLSEYMLNRFCR